MSQNFVARIDCSEAADGIWGVEIPVAWVSELFEQKDKLFQKKEMYSLCSVLGVEEFDEELSQCLMYDCGSGIGNKLAELVSAFLDSIGLKFEGKGRLGYGQPVMWSSRALTYEEAENLAKYLADFENWK